MILKSSTDARLAAAEPHAALAHERVVALGELRRERVHARGLGRVHDGRFVRLGAPHGLDRVGDVVPDGAREERRHLRDEGQALAQRRRLEARDVDAVEHDRAAVHVVEARQEVQQRRLAAAGRPHEGRAALGRHREARAVEDPQVGSRLVREDHVSKLAGRRGVRAAHGVLQGQRGVVLRGPGVGDLGLPIDDLEELHGRASGRR
mmetsp:Transcript_3255/g.9572  ORF Transcript_3255/g.9572 Transcript_3255/m.9572 type:complete len:206 (-) Transcript_3255:45-662(-)